jgi:hypothetical protein
MMVKKMKNWTIRYYAQYGAFDDDAMGANDVEDMIAAEDVESI